jgi:hypothetical protein
MPRMGQTVALDTTLTRFIWCQSKALQKGGRRSFWAPPLRRRGANLVRRRLDQLMQGLGRHRLQRQQPVGLGVLRSSECGTDVRGVWPEATIPQERPDQRLHTRSGAVRRRRDRGRSRGRGRGWGRGRSRGQSRSRGQGWGRGWGSRLRLGVGGRRGTGRGPLGGLCPARIDGIGGSRRGGGRGRGRGRGRGSRLGGWGGSGRRHRRRRRDQRAQQLVEGAARHGVERLHPLGRRVAGLPACVASQSFLTSTDVT